MGRLAALAEQPKEAPEEVEGGRLSRLATTTPDRDPSPVLQQREDRRQELNEKIMFGSFLDVVDQSDMAKELVSTLDELKGTDSTIGLQNSIMLSELFDVPMVDVEFLGPSMISELYGEQLNDLASSVVNKNLKEDVIGALKESPENLKIGTIGLVASTLEAIKRRSVQLAGGGILDDEAVLAQFEAVTPALIPGRGSIRDPENANHFLLPIERHDFLRPERPLPGAILSEAVGTVSRLPDIGAKILRGKQKELVAAQDIATMSNAPITKLMRTTVQSGVPSMGAAVGISLLTGNPLVGLVMLGESEGGAAFQKQIEEGGSVRKALIIGELSQAAEIGGEMLVLPGIVKGFKEGLSVRRGLTLIAENATQEGVTGFNQTFLEVFGTETTRGTDKTVAAKKAIIAGLEAIPENAFVGGAVGGGAGGVAATVDVGRQIFTAREAKRKVKTIIEEAKKGIVDFNTTVLDEAVTEGAIQFETKDEAESFADDMADTAVALKRDIQIDISADNTVTVSEIEAEPAEGDETAVKPVVEGVQPPEGLEAKQEAVGKVERVRPANELSKDEFNKAASDANAGKPSRIFIPTELLFDEEFITHNRESSIRKRFTRKDLEVDENLKDKSKIDKLIGGTGVRSKDQIDELKAKIDKEGFDPSRPISLFQMKDGKVGISDGTHRALVAKELGLEFVPISLTPNMMNQKGREHIQNKVSKRQVEKSLAQPTPTEQAGKGQALEQPPVSATISEDIAGLTREEAVAAGPEAAGKLREAQREGSKVGFKAGERASREKAKVAVEKLKQAQKLTKQRRETAVELVKTFVEKENRGDFLKRVAEAKTPRDLEKINEAIGRGIERAERRSAVNDLKTAAKSINPKKMLPEFAGTAKAILDSIQFGKLRPDTEVKNSDMKAMAQQVLDTAREDSIAAFQAQNLLDELRDKTAKTYAISQLPVESIEQITDTLIALRFQNEADTIAAQGENAKEAIKRRGEVIASIKEPVAIPESLGGKAVKKFKLVHDNLESVLDATAGARPGTYQLWKDSKHATTKYIYDIIDKGVDNQIDHNQAARDILRNILSDNGVTHKDVLNWSMRPEDVSVVKKAFGFGPKPEVHNFTMEDARGKAKEFEFTVNELMSIFMHSQNSHNLAVLLNDGMDRFLKGDKQKIRGFSVATLDQMADALTDTQRKIARQVGSKLMDGFNRDAINKTSIQLEFFEIAKVDNYWPARRLIIRTPKGQQLQGAVKTIEGMGLLKERVGVGNPMRMTGFFETVYGSNKSVSSYVGLAIPLREVKSVWTVPVIEEMENSGRTDEAKLITDLLIRVEDQAGVTQPLDTLIKKMLGGFAKSKLFLNVKIAPRQQISEFLISAYVDVKYLTAFRGLPSKETIAEITALSPQLGKARFDGLQFDRDVGDAFQQNELMNYLTGDTSLIDKTALGMKFFDTNAIVDIYRAVKAEVVDNNPTVNIDSTEGKALLKDRFEWVVRHTQPMWQAKDRSLLGSDPRPLVRALTMFMSQREQLIRMVNNSISDYTNSEKTTEDATRMGRSLGAVAMSMAAFTLFNLAWATVIHRKDRDVKDLTKNFFKDMLSLPFFGKYISSSFELVFNILTDKPVFRQDFGEGPIEGILGDILLEAIPNYARAGKHFVTKEKYRAGPNKGEEKWKNELLVATDSLLDAIASLKGIPYYGAKDIARSIKAQTEEPK